MPPHFALQAVVRFLESPEYSAPVKAFIDDNCVIFSDEEENKARGGMGTRKGPRRPGRPWRPPADSLDPH